MEPTRVYNIEDARAFLAGQGVDVDAIAPAVEGKFMSAFIRAVKPKAAATGFPPINLDRRKPSGRRHCK